MNKYYYTKHGLLFIVFIDVDDGITATPVEDSRWVSEAAAKAHCEILNSDILNHYT